MIPIFTPATARKDVNKVPGDGELAKLANLNRLVENVNTIVANGIPSAAPTLTYSNTGTLDNMFVSFDIKVPIEATYNSGGTKTVQSYYLANIYINDDLDLNQSLTSITFINLTSVNNIQIEYIPYITSISSPVITQLYSIKLQDLFSLTNLNLPFLNTSLNSFVLYHLPLLTSFNFSNIVSILYTIEIVDVAFTSINLSSLESMSDASNVGYSMDIRECLELTTVNIPELVYSSHAIEISNNPNLTSLTLGTIGTLKNINDFVRLSNNALNVGSVNGVLALLVSLDGTNGTELFNTNVYLNEGTNAAPTGQGITDVQTLIDRGCDVQTN